MAQAPTSCVFRADANPRMGTGHVMRCLALAQAWQDIGGRAVFAMVPGSEAIEQRLQAENAAVVHIAASPGSPDDARETADIAHRFDAPWIIVDGYHLDASFHRCLKQAGMRLLLVDDNRENDPRGGDIVLNPNPYADASMYSDLDGATRLLLGGRYTPLRREFLEYRDEVRAIPDVARNVLVTLGGGDADNVTLTVLGALDRLGIPELDVEVLVGGTNTNLEELRMTAGRMGCTVRLERNVKDVPARMAWANLAVSAAGSTCWELAFMGLPCVLVVLADNQKYVADAMHEAGAARNCGWFDTCTSMDIGQAVETLRADHDQRLAMSRAGRQLVDGRGASRVAEAMQAVE